MRPSFWGIDPDLHCTAVAMWNEQTGKPHFATVIESPGAANQQDAVLAMGEKLITMFPRWPKSESPIFAVEAQTLMRSGHRQHKRPQDIVILGNVAGVILGMLQASGLSGRLYFPTPEEWKGSVAKSAMQARLYHKLGWGYTLHGTGSARYARPKSAAVLHEFSHIKGAAWKHVGDAMLLSRWCYERFNKRGK